MTKRYRLGVIGFAHMHVNTLIDEFAELPNVQWVACADTKPAIPSLSREFGTRTANLQRAVECTGIPKTYDDYREMLSKEHFDVIIVCSENARHGEVVVDVATAGSNVVVEKPMSTTYGDALKMVKAAQHHNVSLAINWPSTWRQINRQAQELVAKGEIGEVWKLKYSNPVSMGPMEYGQHLSEMEKGAEWWHQKAMGGGAYLDYCSYGACLSRWFIGQPAIGAYGLTANFHSTYGDAEDNGLVMVRFPKAVAILEGSWTTPHRGIPTGPIVYGSEGVLVCDGAGNGTISVYRKGTDTPTVYEGGALPKGRENIAREFIHHLETGEPLHPTLDVPVNIDAMAILDAGLRSATSTQFELAKNENWS